MTLSREDLHNAVFQRLAAQRPGPPPLSPAALEASVDATLASHPGHADAWVFAYGSLVWNPLLHHVEHRHATLHGYHRHFCLRSELGRGMPGRPGLVLGLDRGGCCRGLAYRIAHHHLRDELLLLWRREMVTGAYLPRWVTLRTPAGPVRAIAFVMNRQYPNYTGRLAHDETVRVLASASGPLGSCADYLLRTHDALRAIGVHDRYLARLAAGVRQAVQARDDESPG